METFRPSYMSLISEDEQVDLHYEGYVAHVGAVVHGSLKQSILACSVRKKTKTFFCLD